VALHGALLAIVRQARDDRRACVFCRTRIQVLVATCACKSVSGSVRVCASFCRLRGSGWPRFSRAASYAVRTARASKENACAVSVWARRRRCCPLARAERVYSAPPRRARRRLWRGHGRVSSCTLFHARAPSRPEAATGTPATRARTRTRVSAAHNTHKLRKRVSCAPPLRRCYAMLRATRGHRRGDACLRLRRSTARRPCGRGVHARCAPSHTHERTQRRRRRTDERPCHVTQPSCALANCAAPPRFPATLRVASVARAAARGGPRRPSRRLRRHELHTRDDAHGAGADGAHDARADG
jgi:hypothetical protein